MASPLIGHSYRLAASHDCGLTFFIDVAEEALNRNMVIDDSDSKSETPL